MTIAADETLFRYFTSVTIHSRNALLPCRNPPVYFRNPPGISRNAPVSCRNAPVLCRNTPFSCRNSPVDFRSVWGSLRRVPGIYGDDNKTVSAFMRLPQTITEAGNGSRITVPEP